MHITMQGVIIVMFLFCVLFIDEMAKTNGASYVDSKFQGIFIVFMQLEVCVTHFGRKVSKVLLFLHYFHLRE